MKIRVLFLMAVTVFARGEICEIAAAEIPQTASSDKADIQHFHPNKNNFELQIVVDFYDDLLACPFNEKTLDEMMRIFKEWGITRVYWNGQAYTSGLYDAASDPNIDTHALHTYQQIGEFIPAAARLAHKYGMEFYIEFKPFDMFFPLLVPHDVNLFKVRNTWRKGIPALGGFWQMGSVFPEQHPEYLMARNMTRIRPEVEKETTGVIKFVKNDDQTTRLAKETLEIYTSCDNHHYKRYSKPYHYQDDVAAHQDSRELDAYGFNAPIVEEYKKRYGVDILRQDFDRVKWSQLIGEYYTEFLHQTKELLAGHGRKMMVDVMPANAAPPDSPQFLNMYLDRPQWFTMADGVSFKWVDPDSPADAVFRSVADRYSIPTYYNVWPHVVYKGWNNQNITDHLKKLKEKRHRGFMLYEAFSFMRAKPDGTFDILYPDLAEIIVPAVRKINDQSLKP